MRKAIVLFFSAVIGIGLMLTDIPDLVAQETEEEFTLEEIVVTAQKREENQQKVPIAMEVISGENLAATGKSNVDDILFNLSNVAITTMADGMRVSIRGLYDNGDLVDGGVKTSSPMVAVNIDGAFNNMSSAGQNLFDVERVEVLYGPQSTMYSSNSPGGILNVITIAPKTDRYSANASANVGSFGLRNYQAAANIPVLSDKIALRLSGSSYRQNSWVEGSTGSKTDAVRLKTLWNATDDLEVTVTGSWSKAGSGGMMGGSVVPFVNQDDVDDPWTSSGDDFGQGANTNDQITKGVNLNINWNTFLGALTVSPNYSQSVAEGTQTGTVSVGPPGPDQVSYTDTWDENNTNTQKGLEVRMASSEDFTLFKWIAGGTYYDYEMKRTNNYVDPASTDTFSEVTQSKKAVFANITYPFWFYDKLSLIIGVRQSWDKSHKFGNMGGPPGQEPTPTNMNYNKPDWRYGLQYYVADNVMLYASYASSYRTDAMAMTSRTQGTRPPEENKSYTLGAKTRMLDNKLQLNTAAYYYDYNNMYANDGRLNGYYTWDEITDNGARPELMEDWSGRSNVIDGVTYYEISEDPNGWGDMRSIGLDTSVSWIASVRDMVNLSVSYLDSKWTKLYFDKWYETIWPDRNYKNYAQPNSPKWSITASYDHNFMLGSFGTLTPHIEWQHKSSFNLCFDTGPLESTGEPDPGYYYQEPYDIWNGSLSFSHSSGKWSLNTLVKNATNYAVKRSFMKSGGNTRMMIGDPRTYQATLSIKF